LNAREASAKRSAWGPQAAIGDGATVTLASGQNQAFEIAVHDMSVDWTNYGTGANNY
jgi:hypothetical protein